MRGKKGLRLTALMLADVLICMGTACGSGEVSGSGEQAQAEEAGMSDEKQEGAETADWTEEQLLQADFLLYNVDCASDDTGVFADDQICGLYQSVSDQPYGADPGSGNVWGYREEEYLIPEQDRQGEGITAGKWTMAEESYPGGEEGAICYDFRLPAGDYSVTVGFYNPFGPRRIDVDCEGTRMV